MRLATRHPKKQKSCRPALFEVLKQEMKAIRPSALKSPVVQISHWGGGNATEGPPEQTRRSFDLTKEAFPFDPDSEIGIEVDPPRTSQRELENSPASWASTVRTWASDFQAEVQRKRFHRITALRNDDRDLIFAARE